MKTDEEQRRVRRERAARWRAAHPGKHAENGRKWRKANPGAASAASRRAYEKDPAKKLARNQAHAERNPERVATWNRSKVAKRRADVALTLYHGASARARDAGLEFTITYDWIRERVAPMRCEVEGKNLRWDPERLSDLLAPSLDRIQQYKGYTPDNTRVVSWGLNALRGPHPDEDVFEWLRAPIT